MRSLISLSVFPIYTTCLSTYRYSSYYLIAFIYSITLVLYNGYRSYIFYLLSTFYFYSTAFSLSGNPLNYSNKSFSLVNRISILRSLLYISTKFSFIRSFINQICAYLFFNTSSYSILFSKIFNFLSNTNKNRHLSMLSFTLCSDHFPIIL